MRTYAGPLLGGGVQRPCTGATLAKGQTGLSVAFDLPTQTGYDPDRVLAPAVRSAGWVCRWLISVICDGCSRTFPWSGTKHLDDHQTPPPMWLLGALPGGRRGTGCRHHQNCVGRRRTTSSRSTSRAGTYVFPPGPSLRLTTDMIAYTVQHIPGWNPINICSYHLQEARCHTGPGDRLRDCPPRSRFWTPSATAAQVPPGRFGEVGRPYLLLRQTRGVRFHRGDVQDAGPFARLWDTIHP